MTESVPLAKMSGFPDAGVLLTRDECKGYRWHAELQVQATICGLQQLKDNTYYLISATDPKVRPWLIAKFTREASEDAGAKHFNWILVTDGEVFWFGDNLRFQGHFQGDPGDFRSGVKNISIELATPTLSLTLLDICKEDIAKVMGGYESHTSIMHFR